MMNMINGSDGESIGHSSSSIEQLTNSADEAFEDDDLVEESNKSVDSPTTYQKIICLNATSKPPKHLDIPSRQRTCTITTYSFPCHRHNITDDYRISQEILGIGESGKVMACYNKVTNEKFALKVLRDGDKARREIELHYESSVHKNIVNIADVYENAFNGTKCLLVVVEFLSGGDLLTRFENQKNRPYSEKDVAVIIHQLANAVRFLHNRNIAHRDIKLENILCSIILVQPISMIPYTSWADFGFAKRPEKNSLMESPCCTPYYVAPEVLGREHYDKSCDMWSIGVVILCGYPPFYSMKGLPLSPGMKTRITAGCYAFPSPDWDAITDTAKSLIRKLLVTDPSKRMNIQELMSSEFITQNIDVIPTTPPRIVVQFDCDTVISPRLHSIQEEVSRALDSMRLGNDSVFIKNPKLASNSLLGRRRQSSQQKMPVHS